MKHVLWQNGRSSVLNMLSLKCQLDNVVDRILKLFSSSRFLTLISRSMNIMRYLDCEYGKLHGKEISQV